MIKLFCKLWLKFCGFSKDDLQWVEEQARQSEFDYYRCETHCRIKQQRICLRRMDMYKRIADVIKKAYS